MSDHSYLERWSWLMHRCIAERIAAGDEAPLRIAERNLSNWRDSSGSLAPVQLEWRDVLGWERSQLLALLHDRQDEEAIRLRANSPFAGALDQATRLELLHAARAA